MRSGADALPLSRRGPIDATLLPFVPLPFRPLPLRPELGVVPACPKAVGCRLGIAITRCASDDGSLEAPGPRSSEAGARLWSPDSGTTVPPLPAGLPTEPLSPTCGCGAAGTQPLAVSRTTASLSVCL